MIPDEQDMAALRDELRATRAHVDRLQEALGQVSRAMLLMCEAADLQTAALRRHAARLDKLEG